LPPTPEQHLSPEVQQESSQARLASPDFERHFSSHFLQVSQHPPSLVPIMGSSSATSSTAGARRHHVIGATIGSWVAGAIAAEPFSLNDHSNKSALVP
jgi:hypothetical protein